MNSPFQINTLIFTIIIILGWIRLDQTKDWHRSAPPHEPDQNNFNQLYGIESSLLMHS